MRATVIKPTLRRPGRSLFQATKAHRGRFFFIPSKEGHPLEREGIERRKGAGARIAPWGARRVRSGAPMTPEGASAPKKGRTPPGALPRHFHESGFAPRASSEPRSLIAGSVPAGRCSLAGHNARRACPKPPRVPEVQAQARRVRRSPLRRQMPLEGALSEPGRPICSSNQMHGQEQKWNKLSQGVDWGEPCETQEGCCLCWVS